MALDTFPAITVSDGSTPKETIPRVIRYKFGDGYTQRVGDGINPVLVDWSLVWTTLSPTDKGTIETFLLGKGGVTAFYWTSPLDSTPHKYTCGRWLFQPHAGAYYTGTAEFTEEADLGA